MTKEYWQRISLLPDSFFFAQYLCIPRIQLVLSDYCDPKLHTKVHFFMNSLNSNTSFQSCSILLAYQKPDLSGNGWIRVTQPLVLWLSSWTIFPSKCCKTGRTYLNFSKWCEKCTLTDFVLGVLITNTVNIVFNYFLAWYITFSCHSLGERSWFQIPIITKLFPFKNVRCDQDLNLGPLDPKSRPWTHEKCLKNENKSVDFVRTH